MSKKAKEPKFRVELRDRRGRFVSLSKAYTVSIFYGKKRILEPHTIPREWKSAKRYDVISNYLFNYEIEKYAEEYKKLEEKKQRKRLKLLAKEYIYKRVKVTDKKNINYGAIANHVRTFTNEYSKVYFEKELLSVKLKKYIDVLQLDFTLNSPIEIDSDNFMFMRDVIHNIIYPHAKKFFILSQKKNKKNRYYILRLKLSSDTGKGLFNHGFSLPRKHYSNMYQFENEIEILLDEFFMKPEFSREHLRAAVKYVKNSIDKTLYFRGFTYEVVKREFDK